MRPGASIIKWLWGCEQPKFADGDHRVQFRHRHVAKWDLDQTTGPHGAAPAFEVEALALFATKLCATRQIPQAGRDMGSHGRVITRADPARNLLQLFQQL